MSTTFKIRNSKWTDLGKISTGETVLHLKEQLDLSEDSVSAASFHMVALHHL